jgi:hypothetical protein
MPANMKKAGMSYMYGGSKKKMAYGGSKKHNLVMEEGGSLKPIPSDNKGLPNLPKAVRNNMGYMKHGGMKKMMGVPGMYQAGAETKMMDMMAREKMSERQGPPPPTNFPFSSDMGKRQGVPSVGQDSIPPVPVDPVDPVDLVNPVDPEAPNPKVPGIPGMYAGGSMTTDSAKNMMGMRKKGGKFPDLTGDGKVTRADILKGRGVI